MKSYFPLVFIFAFLSLGWRDVPFNDPPLAQEFSDTIRGDFNGDGKTELLFIAMDADSSVMMDTVIVGCSDKKIPAIGFTAMSASLTLEGDLDENGTDEISVLLCSEGAWCGMAVLTFHNGQWLRRAKASVYGPDGHTDYVRKAPEKGYFIIMEEWWGENGEFKVTEKKIKVIPE
jgi:hypothetical protein